MLESKWQFTSADLKLQANLGFAKVNRFDSSNALNLNQTVKIAQIMVQMEYTVVKCSYNPKENWTHHTQCHKITQKI